MQPLIITDNSEQTKKAWVAPLLIEEDIKQTSGGSTAAKGENAGHSGALYFS